MTSLKIFQPTNKSMSLGTYLNLAKREAFEEEENKYFVKTFYLPTLCKIRPHHHERKLILFY